MTDFNSLPLADQLKALQAGDELHLRGGGWLPFRRVISLVYLASSDDEVMWKLDGNLYTKDLSNQMDIIRVVRPTERKVPEVVGILREASEAISLNAHSHNFTVIKSMFALLADHFEKGEKP